MYKKVYLEITNNCNLNCSFCIKNKRKPKFMSFDEFKIILEKLGGGGHQTVAGAQVRGKTIEETKNMLVEAINQTEDVKE